MPKQTHHTSLASLGSLGLRSLRGLSALTAACSMLVLSALPSPSATAQTTESLNACAQITAAEQRLACYDKLSGLSANKSSTQETAQQTDNQADNKLQRQVESSPTEQNTQIDTAKAASDSREETPTLEDFGRDSNPAQARIQRNDKDFELIDKVVDLRQYHHGRLEISLSGGQRWRQTAAQRFHLNEGEEVRIYPSDFGTDYRLSVMGRAGFIQVRRIE